MTAGHRRLLREIDNMSISRQAHGEDEDDDPPRVFLLGDAITGCV
jgi:hypothetical protein